MALINKLSFLIEIKSRFGIRGLILYLIRFFIYGRSNSNSCRIFLFMLDKPQPSIRSLESAKEHTFRFATVKDLEDIHNDDTLHAKSGWDTLNSDLKALERGDRCLLQVDGSNIVGYAWIAGSSLVEIFWGFYYNMPDDVIYNYKSFTSSKYRGNGFQALRHLKLIECIKNSEKSRLFGYVDHLNLSSLNGVRKSGYRKIGQFRGTKKPSGKILMKIETTVGNWNFKKLL